MLLASQDIVDFTERLADRIMRASLDALRMCFYLDQELTGEEIVSLVSAAVQGRDRIIVRRMPDDTVVVGVASPYFERHLIIGVHAEAGVVRSTTGFELAKRYSSVVVSPHDWRGFTFDNVPNVFMTLDALSELFMGLRKALQETLENGFPPLDLAAMIEQANGSGSVQ